MPRDALRGRPHMPSPRVIDGLPSPSMLRRQMATKKKDMPKDLEKVTPPVDADEAVEDDDLEVDLDEDALEDLEDDDPLDVDVVVDDEDEDAVDPVGAIEILTPSPAAVVEKTGEAEDEEEEEEPEDEDVEASLDVILKERLVVEDEPEDEEATDVEDKTEGNERVLPKQPDEFVCRSCFLVKHPSQLADKKKMLCRDCV
jgi:Domain of unknown function (DUF4193)